MRVLLPGDGVVCLLLKEGMVCLLRSAQTRMFFFTGLDRSRLTYLDRSDLIELIGSLMTLSSRVSCRGLESAVRPFWTAPGLMSLHSISAQLVVSVSCLV